MDSSVKHSRKNSGVDFGIDSWEEFSVEGSRKNYGVGFGVDSRTDSSVDDSAKRILGWIVGLILGKILLWRIL